MVLRLLAAVVAVVAAEAANNTADIPIGLRMYQLQVPYMYRYHQHNPNLN
jgi:hypothetical protein